MKTLLIIDDEYDISATLEMVFTMEGYAVLTAYNGAEAMKILKSAPCPDLILSDMMMPVMDGYDFVNALKESQMCQGVPVLLISSALLDLSRIDRRDYHTFIRKPFDLEDVCDLVESLVSDE